MCINVDPHMRYVNEDRPPYECAHVTDLCGTWTTFDGRVLIQVDRELSDNFTRYDGFGTATALRAFWDLKHGECAPCVDAGAIIAEELERSVIPSLKTAGYGFGVVGFKWQ